MRSLSVVLWLLAARLAAAQELTRPLFESAVFTPPQSFTSDVEGPAVDSQGTVYAVNFDHQGTIGAVNPDGKARLFVELPEGCIANSIRFDSHGDMITGDYVQHHVFRIHMDTRAIQVLAQDERMNQPNDLAITRADVLYASDPNFKAHTGYVWRIDQQGAVSLLDSLGPANGIEVSPDEQTLYVDAGRDIWAYDLMANGMIGNKRLLITFPDFGLDGMRCDTAGNLYVARIGKGTVAKISPTGKVLREIPLIGKKPTNVAFGGKDGRTLYVTLMDQGNLESFRVDTPGREWAMAQKRQSAQ